MMSSIKLYYLVDAMSGFKNYCTERAQRTAIWEIPEVNFELSHPTGPFLHILSHIFFCIHCSYIV